MATRDKVMEQLGKTVDAHRAAHHAHVLAAREHRRKLAAEAAVEAASEPQPLQVEPLGMAAGIPPAEPIPAIYQIDE